MESLVVENWKDYVVEGVDMEDLEKDLLASGHLDENGCLVLIEDGVDYRKKFWQKYDVAFNDEIISQGE